MPFRVISTAPESIFEMVLHEGDIYALSPTNRQIWRLDRDTLTPLHTAGGSPFFIRATSYGGSIYVADDTGAAYRWTSSGWENYDFSSTGWDIRSAGADLYAAGTSAIRRKPLGSNTWGVYAGVSGFQWSKLFTLGDTLYGVTGEGAIRNPGNGTQVAASAHPSGFSTNFNSRLHVKDGYVYYALPSQTDSEAIGRFFRSNGGEWEILVPYVAGEYPALDSVAEYRGEIYAKGHSSLYKWVEGSSSLTLVDSTSSSNVLWSFNGRMFSLSPNHRQILEWYPEAPTFSSILPGSSAKISHFRIIRRDRTPSQAQNFHEIMREKNI